jgi:hypothetical protein
MTNFKRQLQTDDLVSLSGMAPRRLFLLVDNPTKVLEVEFVDDRQLIKLALKAQSEYVKKAFSLPEKMEDWFDSTLFVPYQNPEI